MFGRSLSKAHSKSNILEEQKKKPDIQEIFFVLYTDIYEISYVIHYWLWFGVYISMNLIYEWST